MKKTAFKKAVLFSLAYGVAVCAFARSPFDAGGGGGFSGGSLTATSITASTITVTSSATISATHLTGNMTVDSAITIDGRDVSVDGTKLDGLPTSALATVGFNGTSQTQRGRINISTNSTTEVNDGIPVTVADNSGTNSTDLTFHYPYEVYIGTATTTDATSTALAVLSLPHSGDIVEFDFTILGRLSSHDGSIIRYTRRLGYENTSGTLTLRLNATPLADFEATTPTNITAATFPAPTISGTNVTINVQGIGGTNMQWRLKGTLNRF